jgi:hypothetical protein
MTRLGAVKRHGYDDTGHERRERLEAIGGCPRCGQLVELWSDTEEWVKRRDGRWRHNEYGCAMGVCCGLLFVEGFEGSEVYQLGKKS